MTVTQYRTTGVDTRFPRLPVTRKDASPVKIKTKEETRPCQKTSPQSQSLRLISSVVKQPCPTFFLSISVTNPRQPDYPIFTELSGLKKRKEKKRKKNQNCSPDAVRNCIRPRADKINPSNLPTRSRGSTISSTPPVVRAEAKAKSKSKTG